MRIIIDTIPHSEQRYETVGDWYYDVDGTVQIRVSDMGNWLFTMLVAVHELCEWILCRARGISQVEVDDFDKAFESVRVEGNTDEPGDEPSAPYHNEHCFATAVERMLCAALGLSWKTYDEKVNSL